VIDGHHRAALARRSGAATIDADVTELIARVPLGAGADMLEVVLRELERIFLEDSGLADTRPGLRIPVSRPAQYLELLENFFFNDTATTEIYTPTLNAIRQLGGRDGELPMGDRFLELHRHRRDAFPSVGCPHIAQTVASVIGSRA